MTVDGPADGDAADNPVEIGEDEASALIERFREKWEGAS
jgi:hypothetical protein